MGRLIQDLRFALRSVTRRPGLTLVAVLSLALGIGANTAIFSVVYAVLLRPLPYFQPDRLVRLYEATSQLDHSNMAPPNLRDWREQGDVFSGLAAYVTIHPNLQGVASTERLAGTSASANLVSVLSAKPLLGRTFVAGEDQTGARNVVVLSEAFWRHLFNGDPHLLGKIITLDGDAYTVVGVMPARFRFPADETNDIWTPQQINPQLAEQRSSHWLRVVARLKPGTQLATAQSEMRHLADRLAQQYPKEQRGRSVLTVPLRQDITGNIRPALLILLGAAGLVLLIACANVANLLLGRAADRRREVAIRVALGATRGHLIRQFLTESILLALTGAAVGLFFAYWTFRILVSLAGSSIPLTSEVGFDAVVFTFLAAIAVLTGIICGLMPARATRIDLTSDLKDGAGKGSDGVSRKRFRDLLVVAETALALVLLVGAGLLMRAFVQLETANSGMVTRNILTMHVPVASQQNDTAVLIRFFQPMLEHIKAIPWVRTAGLMSELPLQRSHDYGPLRIVSRPPDKAGEEPIAEQRIVSPDYFRTLGIPVVQGRAFTDYDAGAAYNYGIRPAAGTAPAVVLINQALARTYFPNRDPIGQRIKLGDSLSAPIVGVVGDVRESGLDVPSAPTSYLSYLQFPQSEMTLVITTSVPATSIITAVRAAIRSVDLKQPVYKVETMDQVVSDSIADHRFYLSLLGTFAVIAFALAAAGIYGVMSYAVTQRTREIGIRMALGARASSVRDLAVHEGMVLVIAGIICGTVMSLALTRLLASLLYGVSSTDPITFTCVASLLAAVALVASYVPAHRAAAVDPTISLRYE